MTFLWVSDETQVLPEVSQMKQGDDPLPQLSSEEPATIKLAVVVVTDMLVPLQALHDAGLGLPGVETLVTPL